MSVKGKIRVGIGGWTFEPWRGSFYEKGLPHARELAYASSRLTTLEINGTFYRSQSPATYQKWRDETPDAFVFALKAPRFATNRKNLAEAGESVQRFIESGLSELGPKLGPINWQFRATKRFVAEEFEAFLALLPKSVDGLHLRHAVEVRHESFRQPEFVALARQYGVAIITAIDSEFPYIADQTAPFAYLRVMGTQPEEPLGYTAPALGKLAELAKAAAEGTWPPAADTLVAPDGSARDVFFYFISGGKERNPHAAMALIEKLGPAAHI